MEEYGTNKIKERKRKRGRCDLFITANRIGFECEAKRLWLNLGAKVKASCRHVKDELNRAEEDIRELKSQKGLALCFVTPAIRKSKIHALDTRLCELINSLNTREHDALVWIGIAKGQKPFGNEFKYPGLLLVVKEVR